MKIKDLNEIKAMLLKGTLTEHSYENVELKRDWSQEHGEKISMLCNGQPDTTCYLIIGVEDDGQLSGKDDSWLSSIIEIVSQHCNQYLDPSITQVDLTTEEIDKSKIIICTVKNPGVVVKWKDKAFSGSGTTKKQLSPAEILELSLSLPGIKDLSKQKVSFIANDDLVRDFCAMGGLEYDEYTLHRLHLDDTKCGELLFANGKFRFVTYDNKGNVTKNETRTGLINILSDSFSEEIKVYYREKNSKPPNITNSMLREAIGNCVGHAAYHENDGEIIVELYPDRISFSNLAYAEYTSLANKWFSSAHKSPNSFLMETLRVANKVDELGRGKQKILSECLTHGISAPVVNLSEAGRYKRWTLQIRFEYQSERYNNLQVELKRQYAGTDGKYLIAYALVLWSDQKFSEIKKYFDAHEAKIAVEILTDLRGPLFFWEEEDRFIRNRWVKVLLDEGKASKGFSEHEENELYERCQSFYKKFRGGLITPQEFRDTAHLSESNSDRNLTSRTLKKWVEMGRLKVVKRGTYKFVARKSPTTLSIIADLQAAFSQQSDK